jgi:hypothetical protein
MIGHDEANREPAQHGKPTVWVFRRMPRCLFSGCFNPRLAYAGRMRPRVEPLEPCRNEGSTRVYCATCGHSEYVHADNSNRRCLYTVCDCNRSIVGAVPDISGQVVPA